MNILQTITEQSKKVLIVFDDVISDMKAPKKLSTIVTEFFLKRKLNISFIFVS